MIWNAFGGIAEDGEALLLPLPPTLWEENGCLSASVLVSIGYSCVGSTSSSSPGRQTLLLIIVKALIARGVGMRLMFWGVSTPFSLRIFMIRLGRISLGLEVVLVASARMENKWAPMSMCLPKVPWGRWLLHCWWWSSSLPNIGWTPWCR